jgi:hypothetical protein
MQRIMTIRTLIAERLHQRHQTASDAIETADIDRYRA